MDSVLVIGASSFIIREHLPEIARDSRLTLTSRKPWDAAHTPDASRTHWMRLDMPGTDAAADYLASQRFDRVYVTPPLWLIEPLLSRLPDPETTRAVVLSSNNAALLADNPDYAKLREAEDRVMHSLLDVVILQPTIISGRPTDPLLGRMLAQARAGRTLHLPGRHTRQWPLHFRDLGRAMVRAGQRDIPKGRYSVAGPEAVTNAEMVERVGQASGKLPEARFLPATPMRWLGNALPVLPNAPALRRAGVHRDPVNPPLPGFTPRHGVAGILDTLTRYPALPS